MEENGLYEMGDLSDEEHDYIVNHFDELYDEANKAREGLMMGDINVTTGDIASNNANRTETTEGVALGDVNVQTGNILSNNGNVVKEDSEEEELKTDAEFEKRMIAKDIKDEEEKNSKYNVDDDIDESYDAEIAETLRIAGVQLDEVSEEDANKGKKDLPVPPIGKANPAKTEEVAPEQAPDWNEVSTEDAMGYDSSLGREPVLNIKETVNKGKIESIMETATRMYAKKDSADWLALDRRYVEKLMLEGVSYSNASKMLMKAKAGK